MSNPAPERYHPGLEGVIASQTAISNIEEREGSGVLEYRGYRIEDLADQVGYEETAFLLLHGDLPVLGFRVGRVAYCTDVSHIPEASFPLLTGLDVLVLDALQHRKHTTHFNVEQAVDAARRIGARQTWFTHIAHGLAHEQTNRELPTGMRLAHDGLRVQGRA